VIVVKRGNKEVFTIVYVRGKLFW